jgi:hypothetical protein
MGNQITRGVQRTANEPNGDKIKGGKIITTKNIKEFGCIILLNFPLFFPVNHHQKWA